MIGAGRAKLIVIGSLSFGSNLQRPCACKAALTGHLVRTSERIEQAQCKGTLAVTGVHDACGAWLLSTNGKHMQLRRSSFPRTSAMQFFRLTSAFALLSVATAEPTVYLIRHGEKPADGGNGLNAVGMQRAQCLRSVFGATSGYQITHIMAQTPKSSRYICDSS